jgi:hypothetical protein
VIRDDILPDQQRDVVAVGLIYVIFCLLEPRAPQIELMYTFAVATVFLGGEVPYPVHKTRASK